MNSGYRRFPMTNAPSDSPRRLLDFPRLGHNRRDESVNTLHQSQARHHELIRRLAVRQGRSFGHGLRCRLEPVACLVAWSVGRPCCVRMDRERVASAANCRTALARSPWPCTPMPAGASCWRMRRSLNSSPRCMAAGGRGSSRVTASRPRWRWWRRQTGQPSQRPVPPLIGVASSPDRDQPRLIAVSSSVMKSCSSRTSATSAEVTV